VISLDPSNLAEVLADVPRLGEAAGVADRAIALHDDLERRLEAVRRAVAGVTRPRVLALEWLDPPFIGGHWVPEMIEIAGGEDALGVAGEKSRTAEWDEITDTGADVVVAMPCGWDATRARAEVDAHAAEVAAIGAGRVWTVDAAASFSRPGPRLVEGTELLAHLLHPDKVQAPEGVPFERVKERTWA
jgi:iron complex transport system substrate-binding protein